jgi:hypothetical protein
MFEEVLLHFRAQKLRFTLELFCINSDLGTKVPQILRF